MPAISRFFGIIIKMYYNDHAPPHFHAEYGGSEILVEIETLAIIAGKMSPRATGLVMEWTALHQQELRQVWQQARDADPLDSIEPLQ